MVLYAESDNHEIVLSQHRQCRTDLKTGPAESCQPDSQRTLPFSCLSVNNNLVSCPSMAQVLANHLQIFSIIMIIGEKASGV